MPEEWVVDKDAGRERTEKGLDVAPGMTALQMSLFDTLKQEVQALPSGIVPSGIVPRDYQQTAVEKVANLWAQGSVGALVRLATGTGKTILSILMMSAWLAMGKDRRVIVLCHEIQLIDQFADEVEDVLKERPGIEQGKNHVAANRLPKITIASRDSLRVAKTEDEEGNEVEVSRLFKFDVSRYKFLVVVDEAHHYLKRGLVSSSRIFEWFDGHPRIGLTATPERGDKRTLGDLFPDVAADYPLYKIDGGPCAVRDGWAVPYDQRFVVAEGVDFKNLNEVAKDFDNGELERILGEREMLLKLVVPTLDLVGNRRTIIFSATKNLAKWVAHTINEFRPEQAVSIDGDVVDYQRKDIYRRHKAGEFQFLSCCSLCREAYDDPGIQAVAVFRITKARWLAEQMKGRGCRPLRGCVDSTMTREERLAAIADSEKPNCIAEGTLILTDHGEVPIERVTTAMKVWDGVAFVSHCGIISRGYQEVITYAGLTATPDHEVCIHDEENTETKTETWAAFGDCAAQQIAIRITGIGGEAVWETDGHHRRGN